MMLSTISDNIIYKLYDHYYIIAMCSIAKHCYKFTYHAYNMIKKT